MDKKFATKQVKKYTPSKNLYLYLMDYIKDNQKLPLDTCSKQKINYYLKDLKSMGIIYKIGYGVWHIDEEKYKEYRFQTSKKTLRVTSTNHERINKRLPEKIRGHGFMFTVPIDIVNWEKREEYLIKKSIKYENIVQGQKIVVKNCKIWLCNNSIVVYFNKDLSFYDETASKSLESAKNYMKDILVSIENLLNIKLKTSKGYNFRISRNHYARINNLIAKESNKNDGLKLYYDGKLWLLTDKSFNTDELETVSSSTGVLDQDNIGEFLNDFKRISDITGEVPKFSKIFEVLNKTSQIIEMQNVQIGQLTSTLNELMYKPVEKLKDRDSYFG